MFSLFLMCLFGISNLPDIMIDSPFILNLFLVLLNIPPDHPECPSCHSEHQRRIWGHISCTLSYLRSFTPPAAPFRMTGHHFFPERGRLA